MITYLTWFLSKWMSSNILMKAADSFSKTPSALIDKLINFTALNFFFWSLIIFSYFDCLRLMLFLRLDSYPTVSSKIYRQLSNWSKRTPISLNLRRNPQTGLAISIWTGTWHIARHINVRRAIKKRRKFRLLAIQIRITKLVKNYLEKTILI